MTQEQKELLFKDICTRLPYGVKVEINSRYIDTLTGIDGNLISTTRGTNYPIDVVKPYLRPMSSMTEEEKEELLQLLVGKLDAKKHFQVNSIGIFNTDKDIQLGPNWIYHFMNFSFENVNLCYNYLIRRYFDVVNLISLGLAHEALDWMYK